MSDDTSPQSARPFLASDDVRSPHSSEVDSKPSSDFAPILPLATTNEAARTSEADSSDTADVPNSPMKKVVDAPILPTATGEATEEVVEDPPMLPEEAVKEGVASTQAKAADNEFGAESPILPDAEVATSQEMPKKMADPETRSRLESLGESSQAGVTPPMAHYARPEAASGQSSVLTDDEIKKTAYTSGSTKKVGMAMLAGLAVIVGIGVAVYGANQNIYRLSPVEDKPAIVADSDITSPSTLAAAAGTRTLEMKVQQLPALDEGHYQLWLEQDGETASLGAFKPELNGGVVDLDGVDFTPEVELSGSPAKLLVTIEAGQKATSSPSSTVLMEGEMTPSTTNLSFAAVDRAAMSGEYVIAAATSDEDEAQTSGVWLAKVKGGKLVGPGLNLPEAPSGWKYEAQMIFKDQVLAMGRFGSAEGKDDFNRYTTSPEATPGYPGEDYLKGAPSRLGLDFPTNLTSGEWKLLVTLEPDKDGSDPTGDDTFYIHLLEVDIAKGSETWTNYPLKVSEKSLPKAQVSLK